MEQKTFKIYYSLLVNGDEYPREIIVVAEDRKGAEEKLRNMNAGGSEIVINDVVIW